MQLNWIDTDGQVEKKHINKYKRLDKLLNKVPKVDLKSNDLIIEIK